MPQLPEVTTPAATKAAEEPIPWGIILLTACAAGVFFVSAPNWQQIPFFSEWITSASTALFP